jgi:hypothetical protein
LQPDTTLSVEVECELRAVFAQQREMASEAMQSCQHRIDASNMHVGIARGFLANHDGRGVAALAERVVKAIGGFCRAPASVAGGKVKSAHQTLYSGFRGRF